MMYPVSFGSDNHSGVHPAVMKALMKANEGYVSGYGDDPLTKEAAAKIKKMFGGNCDVWFVMTGTGANVIALQCLLHSFHSVLCSSMSHINVDECGAVQKFTQSRLEPVATPDGKLTPELIDAVMGGRGDEHRSQKRVISISQSTEYGTVYSAPEIRELSRYAHQNKLYLHLDGARLANAAAHLNISLQEMIAETGVDILSFGGTKNGMMFGEAVISFVPQVSEEILYYRKQATQLFSKMRYISAQFSAYLQDDLWLHNARHSNRMAQLLATGLSGMTGLQITSQVESNAVFVILPQEIIEPLQQLYHFYVWDERRSEVRLMCSFNTSEEQIESFLQDIKRLL